MLRSLIIDDCSKLKHVAGLDALQHLRLVFPPSTETFYFEELIIFWSIAFPQWLELLIQKCKGLRRFELQCSLSLLRSCLDGGKNWHIVQQIHEVRIISCDGKRYIRYNKNRQIYETNAQSEEWSNSENLCMVYSLHPLESWSSCIKYLIICLVITAAHTCILCSLFPARHYFVFGTATRFSCPCRLFQEFVFILKSLYFDHDWSMSLHLFCGLLFLPLNRCM